MAAWRKEEVDAARHRQDKREATRLGNLLSHTEAQIFAKRHPLTKSTSRRNPCTDARRTEICVAPLDASRDFFFLPTSSVGGGGGMHCQTFSFVFSFPCSADHERDLPPCREFFSGWQPIR